MENDDNKDFDLELNEEDEVTEETQEPDWKAEAMKYKSIAKRLKTKIQPVEKKEEIIQTQPTNNYADEYGELRFDGYSKQEADFIMKNGGRKVLEDPNSFVTIAIKTQKEQKRAEDEANKVVDTSQLSEVERKYTPEQLANMSREELEKILPRSS